MSNSQTAGSLTIEDVEQAVTDLEQAEADRRLRARCEAIIDAMSPKQQREFYWNLAQYHLKRTRGWWSMP